MENLEAPTTADYTSAREGDETTLTPNTQGLEQGTKPPKNPHNSPSATKSLKKLKIKIQTSFQSHASKHGLKLLLWIYLNIS